MIAKSETNTFINLNTENTKAVTNLPCILVNPCESSPCKNGGTCANNGDSFSCTCTDKFEGPTCEEKGWLFYNFNVKIQS